MMEKFELCFEIQDSKRQQFLIPELLSKEEPDINWDYENSLAFQYHYDVLPSSIMSRFIVRMQQLISKKTYWRSISKRWQQSSSKIRYLRQESFHLGNW